MSGVDNVLADVKKTVATSDAPIIGTYALVYKMISK